MKNKSVHSCWFVHHAKFHCIITTLNKLFKIEFESGGGGNWRRARIWISTQLIIIMIMNHNWKVFNIINNSTQFYIYSTYLMLGRKQKKLKDIWKQSAYASNCQCCAVKFDKNYNYFANAYTLKKNTDFTHNL